MSGSQPSVEEASGVLVSVIIVTYNAAGHLERTLDSVRAQTDYEPGQVEIIQIDGDSTDDSAAIGRNSGLVSTLISEPDQGIYDAMNKGLARARGEWVQFLNAGDAYRGSRALATIMTTLANDHSAHAWAITRAVHLGGGAGPESVIRNVPHDYLRHAFGLQPHCHQATLFRASELRRVGGHPVDVGTAGDFEVILRFGQHSSPLVIAGTNIDYLGGGVSEKSSLATASLQHLVRAKVWRLGRAQRMLDKVAAMTIGSLLGARIKLGHLRARLLADRQRRRT